MRRVPADCGEAARISAHAKRRGQVRARRVPHHLASRGRYGGEMRGMWKREEEEGGGRGGGRENHKWRHFIIILSDQHSLSAKE